MVAERESSAEANELAREVRAKIRTHIKELASEDGMTRQAARYALAEIGTAAAPALLEILEDPRDQVRWESAKCLVEIADPQAAPALVKALEDEDGGVRWLAAEGLIVLDQYGLPPLLEALTERSDSLWLREGSRHVIHELPMWKIVRALTLVLDALERAAPESAVPVAANDALGLLKAVTPQRRRRTSRR